MDAVANVAAYLYIVDSWKQEDFRIEADTCVISFSHGGVWFFILTNFAVQAMVYQRTVLSPTEYV